MHCVQISYWGNVLIHHVCEWKHWKRSPWACPFSGGFQIIIFLQLLQIWSSYCFHCDKRTHKATTRQSVENWFYWQSKILPPFAHLLALSHVWFLIEIPLISNQFLTTNWWILLTSNSRAMTSSSKVYSCLERQDETHDISSSVVAYGCYKQEQDHEQNAFQNSDNCVLTNF